MNNAPSMLGVIPCLVFCLFPIYLGGKAMINGREIITLCGSSKFKDEYETINHLLTRRGKIVISVSYYGHADNINFTETVKNNLDAIHKDKILLSDAIFVINKNGYIGESTKSEIEFANKHKKKIYYLEPILGE
jgi:hypothetical protein